MNKRGVLGLFQKLFLIGKLYDNPYLELSLLSVNDLMTKDVITINKNKNLTEAAHTMIAAHISCLVVNQGSAPIGIITERDFIKKLDMGKPTKKEKTVGDLMSKNLQSVLPNAGIFQVMKIMRDNDIRKVVVISNGALLGIITQTDLCKAISNMTTCIIDAPLVKDVMTKKLLVANPDESVSSIKKIMAQKNMGSVMIMKKEEVQGMFTEYDVVSEYFMNPNKLKNSRMIDLMIVPVVCISPDFDLVFVNKLMFEKGFRRLPVLSDGKVVGIVTQTDVARKLYEHLEKNKDTKYPKFCKMKNQPYNIIKKGNIILYQKK